MLRGYRGILVAFGLAVLLAAMAAGALILEATRSEAFYQQQAEQNAKADRHTARIHAERACVAVAGSERAKCIDEQYHAAWERERNEYDLQAQLVTSSWTRAMGMAAIIGMFVGIVGVGLVFTTFRETRRSADAAHDANRPWLQIDIVEVERLTLHDEGASISATVKIINRGNSPAIHVLAFAALAGERGNSPGTLPTMAVRKLTQTLDLWKGSLGTLEGTTVFPGAFLQEDYRAHLEWSDVKGAQDDGSAFLTFAVGVSYRFSDKVGRTVASFDVLPAQGTEGRFALPGARTTQYPMVILVDNLASYAE